MDTTSWSTTSWSDDNGGTRSPDKEENPKGDGESKGQPDDDNNPTGSSFAKPDPDFNPEDNREILAFYDRKAKQGVLGVWDATEDSPNDVALRRIAEFEKIVGRTASDEERQGMIDIVLRIYEASWLDALKIELVGKTHVRMEHFNRLVAEREKSVQYITRRLSLEEKRYKRQIDRIKELKAENSFYRESGQDPEAREKLQEMELEKKELEDQRDNLQKRLDGLKLSDDSNTREKEKQELQDKIKRLEADLRSSRENGSKRYEEFQRLKTEAAEGRIRERALKDAAREADNEIKRLTTALTLASASAPGSTGKDTDQDLVKENEGLRQRIKELEDQALAHLESDPPSNTADISELRRERLAMRADNKHLHEELEKANYRFLQHTATERNLLDFWEAIDKTREKMGDLMRGIEALAQALGFDEGIHAEMALKFMLEEAKKFPNDTRHLGLIVLKVSGDLQTTRARLVDAEERVQDLETDPPRPKTEAELRAELRIVDEEEMEKRVQAATQTYRLHRRDVLDVIFTASGALTQIAHDTSDAQISERITRVVTEHLSPEKLPHPRPTDA
ncbi:hypothetical protein F4779DRAFT_51306 [Xylariaceae sp. FL0662B]|nr:hypothetical protein F4779DRAFT_51306 [Xylariaceae sp. FL0662B]